MSPNPELMNYRQLKAVRVRESVFFKDAAPSRSTTLHTHEYVCSTSWIQWIVIKYKEDTKSGEIKEVRGGSGRSEREKCVG